nr:protein farnesyltransferase subunit beta [Zonotrichia albicollis]
MEWCWILSKVEDIVQEVYDAYKTNHHSSQYVLQREKHFHYLKRGLRQLTEAYECLDASRPWLCYWILHSLELLDEPIPDSVASDVCQFLRRCQSPQGGFGGGPGQHPHLAPTYAAVNALCIIGTEEAFGVIDRKKLLEYLYSLKQPDGSFLMHVGGEVDVRSAYCAASVASLTNILTPALFAGTAEWIARCQNWEGGIGGVPGMEAHGGYTFCGVAALVILKQEHLLNLRSLLVSDPSRDTGALILLGSFGPTLAPIAPQHWVTGRQMRFEGGFQGRCNKLVDGSRDFYHTCYCLSGLAIAQHFGSGDLHNEVVLGIPENCLQATHPVYNIAPEKVARAVMHFLQYPVPSLDPAPAAQ